MSGRATLLVEDGIVVTQEGAGTRDCWWLTIQAPHIAPHIGPGQFVMLRLLTRPFPYLGRPFSVADRDPAHPDRLAFAYTVQGEGTRALAAARPGDRVRVVGPLGRPFPLPPAPVHVLVGGGIGSAPFPLLLRELRQAQPKSSVLAYLGGRSAEDLHLAGRLAALGAAVEVATEDGSRGCRGTVVDLLTALPPPAEAVLYACGPKGMLQALQGWLAGRGHECYASLEEHMACGFGACNACVVPVAGENGERYALVCLEGPVMDLRRVSWTPGSGPMDAAPKGKCEVRT